MDEGDFEKGREEGMEGRKRKKDNSGSLRKSSKPLII